MGIADKINYINNEIGDEVTLIAVSKTKPIKDLEEAYNAGTRDFGENKVQELCMKEENLPKDIRWHLIGHLQTNKIKYIVGKVFLIHSLDSIKLLKALDEKYKRANLVANTLIQVNIGKEESKSGIYEDELEDLIEEVEKCTNVKVQGIMVIIPKGDESTNKHYFRKTKNIYEQLKDKNYNNIEMKYLSMGMTNDYKYAIEEGSNMIRVGQGIFGKRN